MHFYFICCHPSDLHGYLQVQLIEQVFSDVGKDLESVLWEREKYWQCQLFTNTHGMNILFDLEKWKSDCNRTRTHNYLVRK